MSIDVSTLRGSRRRLPISTGELVERVGPPAGASLPLVVRPASAGVDLVAWGARHRERLDGWLDRHGAVLLRGFGVAGAEQFGAAVEALAGQTLEYRERSTPRHAVHGNVYTSTEYPNTESIPLHCENSYAHSWPLRLLFHCAQPAATGGATPVADVRRVLARIDPAVVERFSRLGVRYVRNLGGGLGLDWREAFGTADRARVEELCVAAGYALSWHGDRLRLVRNGPAVVRHPRTGEAAWFNHTVLFHVSSLPSALAADLIAEFGRDGLPSNTYYGDGAPIEPEVLDGLRAAYAAETVAVPWEAGDVMVVDNMLAAHGRAPYTGARTVLVAMTHPLSSADLETEV